MARKTIWFGDRQANGAEAQKFGVKHAVWPDIDTKFAAVDDPITGKRYDRPIEVARLFALHLAPDTDHDVVRVFVGDGDKEGELLGPGMLLRYDGQESVSVHVRPAVPYPSTRLLASRANEFAGRKLGFPVGQSWELVLSGGFVRLKNTGDEAAELFVWDGDVWASAGFIPAGTVAGAGNVNVPKPDYGGHNARFVDYSLDKIVNLGDLVRAGALLYAGAIYGLPGAGQPLIDSAFDLDSNGNPGTPVVGSEALTSDEYVSPIAQAAIDARWDGRCGIVVWDGEEPPCDFRPRLLPERVIVLGAIEADAEDDAGTPGDTILVVPAMNVASAQLTFRHGGTGEDSPLDVALGSPLADERLDGAALTTTDVETVAVGEGGAVSILENIHGLISIVAGGNGGVGKLAAGATLTLRRAFIG
jgi:hypothetical protein